MITSLSNPNVKLVRSLARRKARYEAHQFVVEGVRLIEEAVNANIVPAFALYTAHANDDARAHALLDRLRVITSDTLEVNDEIMQALASTETPQGIAAVLPFVELPARAQPQFVLILDTVHDPGNVGTIMRSARAAGVDLIFFAHGTADPYNDKVVRAAMGAHFAVPFRVASWQQIADTVRAIPRTYLADARGEIVYSQADWSRPVAIIVGGEAEGASEEARKVTKMRVRIPMRGDAESLNAAMATTVLLFQAAQA